MIWGDHDPVVPRSDQDLIIDGIRGAGWSCTEAPATASIWSNPNRLFNDLADFVAYLS